MGKISTPKTKLYIAEEQAACDTVAEYEALTWVPVAGIVDLGEVGAEYKDIEYETLDDGLIHRLKGALDSGKMAVKLARDPANPGQSAIISALPDYENYNFKIAFNDAPKTAGANPTRLFFPAKVMSYKTSIGSGSKLVEASTGLNLDGEVLEAARGT